MLTYNVILELYQYLIKAQDWHLSPESASILPRESVASQGDRMNTKELNAFTARWLMALKTSAGRWRPQDRLHHRQRACKGARHSGIVPAAISDVGVSL